MSNDAVLWVVAESEATVEQEVEVDGRCSGGDGIVPGADSARSGGLAARELALGLGLV